MPERDVQAFPSRFVLYEHAVANAPALARFARRIAPRARIMREDFAGTGALARAWINQGRTFAAIAIDKDKTCSRHTTVHDRLTIRTQSASAAKDRADIIAATNFAVGYWHTRTRLVRYLAHARRCINARGMFVCDMYGGEGCFEPMVQVRRISLPEPFQSVRAKYVWEQVEADACTGMVRNAIHFELSRGGVKKQLRSAFTYHWRLWSIPELREAMLEAGYARVDVYDRLCDGIDQHGREYVSAVRRNEPLDATWVVYVVGRVGGRAATK